MCQLFQLNQRLTSRGTTAYLWLLLTVAAPQLSQAQPPPAAADQPAPTTWTSNKGVEVEADFVRMTDDAVVLKMKRDGKEATVPLTALSIDSIYQATRLAHPEGFSKPVPKAVIKPKMTVELPQLDLNVDDMLRSPFTSATNIDQFFQTVDRLSQEGNFFSAWHGLPPKMQTDIEDLIVKGHQVLGPTTLKQIQLLLNDLNTIVRDKQQFILGLPEVSANPQLASQLEQNWPLIAKLVSGLANEEHWQASNFQKGNVTRWLAKLNIDLAPAIMAGLEVAQANLPPGVALPKMVDTHNILSQTADSAEVEVTVPGVPPVKTTFQKVGNVWINVPAMNQLRQSLDVAKEKLASGAAQEVGLIRTFLGSAIAGLGGLARANSQEEFDEAVGLLRTIGAGLNQSLGFKADSAAAGGPGPGGRSEFSAGGP